MRILCDSDFRISCLLEAMEKLSEINTFQEKRPELPHL